MPYDLSVQLTSSAILARCLQFLVSVAGSESGGWRGSAERVEDIRRERGGFFLVNKGEGISDV